jgi:YesN/AraC family two-component response regulator
LEEAITILRRENFENRRIAGERCRFLYHDVYGTYRKLRDSLGGDISELPKRLDEEAGEQTSSLEELLDQFREITRQMFGAKRSHNKELIQGITRYLQENFKDPGLGLSLVASEFSITESYLSFFFKEQTGENFSSYIETLRIDQAVHLLKSTDAGIQSVAQMVGYNNDKTFRRVFKKLKGLSPSEFRFENSQKQIL